MGVVIAGNAPRSIREFAPVTSLMVVLMAMGSLASAYRYYQSWHARTPRGVLQVSMDAANDRHPRGDLSLSIDRLGPMFTICRESQGSGRFESVK